MRRNPIWQWAALVDIAILEASQPRAVPETLLGVPGALDRLKPLGLQIAPCDRG